MAYLYVSSSAITDRILPAPGPPSRASFAPEDVPPSLPNTTRTIAVTERKTVRILGSRWGGE